jgi:hypothetical protein
MSSIITSSNKKSAAILSMAALVSILLCVPLLFKIQQEVHEGNKGALIGLLLLALPIVFGTLATYCTILWFKFGESRLELVSATIGHGLAGVAYAPARANSTKGFQVVLNCTNHKSSSGGSGDNSHTYETILWQDTLSLHASLSSSDNSSLALPVLFQIPPHIRHSDSSNRYDRIVWTLGISAELPGIDYHSTFTIPVVRLPEELSKLEPLDINAITDYIPKASEASCQDVEGIVISEFPAETHLRFKCRRFTNIIPFQILTVVVWGIALSASVFFNAPLFAPLLLAILELASVLGVMDTLTGTAEIRMETDQLVASITYLGLHRHRIIDWQDVMNIEVVRSFQHAGHLYVKIRITKKDGRGISIGRSFKDSKNAEEIVDKLITFLPEETRTEMNGGSRLRCEP